MKESACLSPTSMSELGVGAVPARAGIGVVLIAGEMVEHLLLASGIELLFRCEDSLDNHISAAPYRR